jgi:hypothetical protein
LPSWSPHLALIDELGLDRPMICGFSEGAISRDGRGSGHDPPVAPALRNGSRTPRGFGGCDGDDEQDWR